MTIADTGHLEVGASFTEEDVTKIKKGQPATITFDALPDETASGKVSSIDQTSTTSDNVVRYGVRVALLDAPDGVRLGQTTSVQVTTGKAENVLYVPSNAVRTAGGRSTVTVVDKNGAQVTRTVTTGLSGDQGTEIKSGLTAGESVVINTTTSSTGSQNGFPGGGPGGGLGGGIGRGIGGGR
jgi:macrolide-specific efflux system membrane fusion protein